MTVVAEDGTLSISVTEKASEKAKYFAMKQGMEDDFWHQGGGQGGWMLRA